MNYRSLPDRRSQGNHAASPSRASSLNLEDDPFESQLDEDEGPLPAAGPDRSGYQVQIAIAGNCELARPSGAAFHATYLQCPFCQSVFRSTVAGGLDQCPVCIAIAGRDQKSKDTTAAPEPVTRLTRTGTFPAPKMHRSRSRSGLNGRQHDNEPSACSERFRRWFTVGGYLLGCVLLAVIVHTPTHLSPPYTQAKDFPVPAAEFNKTNQP